MIVAKFGGTSVADAAAIERTAEIVRGRLPRHPVVVVSALAGTTNALLAIGEQAARGHLIGAVRAVEGLRERHLAAADALLGAASAEVCAEMSATFDELAHLAEALSVLGDLTPRSHDAIAATGEILSSQLVAAALHARGVPATHVDARQVMITDATFGRAEPQPDAIADAARRLVLPIVQRGEVPILGGYIGATAQGVTTTLGRGGSDYTAALLGAAMRAEAIEIWTDVDGMLTADPRTVPAARRLDVVGFDEASELAAFGARVLHPYTIAPAVRLGIPVWILNSYRPEGTGTRISFEAPRRPVTAIAGRGDITLIEVRTPRMLLTHGFLHELFGVFERHRISVDVVATSEVSVSVTLEQAEGLDALVVELRALGDVRIERGRGIVAVVGAGISDDGRTLARALAALQDVPLRQLSLGATGINLTVVLDGDRVPDALRRLHAAFFEEDAA